MAYIFRPNRKKPVKQELEVDLDPGDMLIYSGCDLEHWREEFKGKNCGQVFLHYNNKRLKLVKKINLIKDLY